MPTMTIGTHSTPCEEVITVSQYVVCDQVVASLRRGLFGGWGRGRRRSQSGQAYQVVEKLLTNDLDHLKGLQRCNRIDQHVAVDTDKVLAVHYAVLILHVPVKVLVSLQGTCRSRATGKTYLASGVDDLCRELLPFVLDDLAESVFNCRVVTLNEVAVDELDCKRRLACVVM